MNVSHWLNMRSGFCEHVPLVEYQNIRKLPHLFMKHFRKKYKEAKFMGEYFWTKVIIDTDINGRMNERTNKRTIEQINNQHYSDFVDN